MHDSRGAALKVGDRVLIEAEVKSLCEGDDIGYCNVTIDVVTPQQAKPPEMTPPSLSAINTRMLTKIGAMVAICLATFASPGTARADWVASNDGSWTFKADSEPVKPKAGCVCGDDCACKPGDCPGKCPVAEVKADAGGHYVQVCENGRCLLVWVPDSPAAAKSAVVQASASAACETCSSASSSAGPLREARPVRRLLGLPFRLFRGACCGG